VAGKVKSNEQKLQVRQTQAMGNSMANPVPHILEKGELV
jgi:hypothetical protein